MSADLLSRWGLRLLAIGYLLILLLVPVGYVFWETFGLSTVWDAIWDARALDAVQAVGNGISDVWTSITTPAAISAFWLTVTVTAIAVPLNAIFGIAAALVLVRGRVRGKRVLNALIDLPFAVSPVVIGLGLVLLYGRTGWFGPWLTDNGIRIIFSVPGIVLATIFVSLPFVAREVAPVLREVGDEQEQAAATLGASGWQTFWRITLPAIRWGLAYGVVLSTARAIGEFGAVSVVSGKIAGETQTLTTLVEERYANFDIAGAYAASALMAVIALLTLAAMTFLGSRNEKAR